MTQIEVFRKEINSVDTELISLLKKRIEISKKISKFKKENKIPIFDPIRENEIINFFTTDENSENKIYIEKFLHILMDISKEVQEIENRSSR